MSTALQFPKWAVLLLALTSFACAPSSSPPGNSNYEKMVTYIADHVDFVDLETSYQTNADGDRFAQFHFDIENRGSLSITFAVVLFEFFDEGGTKVGSRAVTVFYPGVDQAPAIPLPASGTWEMRDGKYITSETPVPELDGLEFKTSIGFVGFAESEILEHE